MGTVRTRVYTSARWLGNTGWGCAVSGGAGGASKLITTTMSIAAEGKPRGGGEGGKGVKSELNTCAETWWGAGDGR